MNLGQWLELPFEPVQTYPVLSNLVRSQLSRSYKTTPFLKTDGQFSFLACRLVDNILV